MRKLMGCFRLLQLAAITYKLSIFSNLNKTELKTSGILPSTLLALSLFAILIFIHLSIFKLSINLLLILYFAIITILIITSFYCFRGRILLEIDHKYLQFKWLKKPLYTSINDSRIKLEDILKSSYSRSSRGPDRIKIILNSSSKPLYIAINTLKSAELNIENGFHKKLVSKINETSTLEKKLTSLYYLKLCSWINYAKTSIYLLIAASISLGIYLAFYAEVKIIEQLFLATLFGLLTSVILLEFFKYTRKEFLQE